MSTGCEMRAVDVAAPQEQRVELRERVIAALRAENASQADIKGVVMLEERATTVTGQPPARSEAQKSTSSRTGK
jgi:hypothetical protein